MNETETLSQRIAKLARLMAEAPDLQDVEICFYDEVVCHPAFIAEGHPAMHKPLRDLVGQVAKAYGHPLRGCKLYHLPKFSLWHGLLGNPLGAMAMLVYFDDQHCGMASFARLAEGLSHRIRFSLPEGVRDPGVELGEMEITSISRRSGRASA